MNDTPIGNYALIGNLRCAALVSQSGSIDWYCPGQFDSPAAFSALLGRASHGLWQIAPREHSTATKRRYRADTLVLETCFTTDSGRMTLTDVMPLTDGCDIVRKVRCDSGTVAVKMHCAPRPDFGKSRPEARLVNGRNRKSPDTNDPFCQVLFEQENSCFRLAAKGAELEVDRASARAMFTLAEGEEAAFILSYVTPDDELQPVPDVDSVINDCAQWWRQWVRQAKHSGPWDELVKRSLITLKAMTFEPDGGMVAAVTSSLPEVPGGEANYDYRFCWLRDAAFALKALINTGYMKEARAWHDWLVKAMHQHEGHLHALYTVEGKVAPEERELDWLPGYLESKPVRAGNAASEQYQLDIRGEIIEVLHLARSHGMDTDDDIWELQCGILKKLGACWREPDEGIWEFRTLYEHLTHSKVMCWLAYDRAISDAERFDLPAPLDEWRRQRDEIRADVLEHGVDPDGGFFTQRYGASDVDASLLMIPLVGFLPADDPRMLATVAEIERRLGEDGLIRRYRTGDQANVEGVFLPCCFWLVDNYWLVGRKREAEALFKRLIGLCNDVGLLSEEYDGDAKRLLGNFPQGLSHLALVSTARLMATEDVDAISLE